MPGLVGQLDRTAFREIIGNRVYILSSSHLPVRSVVQRHWFFAHVEKPGIYGKIHQLRAFAETKPILVPIVAL